MIDVRIPLTQLQKEIMQEFYRIPPTQVIINKAERNKLWRLATKRSPELNLQSLKTKCPALEQHSARCFQRVRLRPDFCKYAKTQIVR